MTELLVAGVSNRISALSSALLIARTDPSAAVADAADSAAEATATVADVP